jgi:predicted RNA methylase
MHCRLKKVVGVEISEQLYGIATRNLARQPERIWLSPVELVCTDAAAFKIAPDVTLVFLNNPFMGEVFERVLSNILESVHTHPRVLRIIAIGAFMHERYLARGFTLRQLGRGMFEYTVRPPTDV